MWERLKQSDLLLAKQELRLRVDETLRRHAAELKGLDADLAEVETLNRLVDAFSAKFGTAPPTALQANEPAAEPARAPAGAAVNSATGDSGAANTGAGNAGSHAGERRPSNVRQLDPGEPAGRGGPRTNFDAFSRAVAKTDRW